MKAFHLSCQPILLPQENFFEKCQKGILDITGIILHASGLDPYNIDKSNWVRAILDIGGKPQHLYLVSKSKLKKGDWCIHEIVSEKYKKLLRVIEVDDKLVFYNDSSHSKIGISEIYKVEASTDKSLGLPTIHSKYVEWYLKNRENISEIKIMVTQKGRICLNKKNKSVIILKPKQSEYNKAMMIALI